MEAKAELKHGQWLPWLKASVPFTHETARKYTACYENRAKLKFQSDWNLSDAYALIERVNFWLRRSVPHWTAKQLSLKTR